MLKLISILVVLQLQFGIFKPNCSKNCLFYNKTGKNTIKDCIPEGYVFMPSGSFTSFAIYLPDTSASKNIQRHSDTVLIKKTAEDFFISKYEETVGQYNEYLIALKRDSLPEVYLSALPDTMIYQKSRHQYGDPYIGSLYFSHPGYEMHPITGISFEQALAYCRWKTIYVNKKICEIKHIPFDINNLIVEFRLPTTAEYEYALRYNKAYGIIAKNTLNWWIERRKNWSPKAILPFYFPIPYKGKRYKETPDIYPLNVTYQQSLTKTNLYNMNDNVSEWVNHDSKNAVKWYNNIDSVVLSNEKLIAGGSFLNPKPEPECYTPKSLKKEIHSNPLPVFINRIDDDKVFSSVGFRCVMIRK